MFWKAILAECTSAVRLLHSFTAVVHLKIAFKWKEATTKGLVTIGSTPPRLFMAKHSETKL